MTPSAPSSPPPGAYPPLIDLGHFADLEDNRADPYYPGTPEQFPNAGVTAGMGFDFGQQDHALMRAGLSPETYNAVSPFVGLRGKAATAALQQNGGMQLSPAQLSELNDYALRETERKAALYTNQFAGQTGGRAYEELEIPERTVLAGLTHLYGGVTGQPETKAYAEAVASGNREAALQSLAALAQKEGPYQGRHQRDLEYLQIAYSRSGQMPWGAPSGAPAEMATTVPPAQMSVEELFEQADALHIDTDGKSAGELRSIIATELSKNPEQRDAESQQRLAAFEATSQLKALEQAQIEGMGPVGAFLDFTIGPKYTLDLPGSERGMGFRRLTAEDLTKDIEKGSIEFSNFDVLTAITFPWASIWKMVAARGAEAAGGRVLSTGFRKAFEARLKEGAASEAVAKTLDDSIAKLALEKRAKDEALKVAAEGSAAKQAAQAESDDLARQMRNLWDQRAEVDDLLAKQTRAAVRVGAGAFGQEFVKNAAIDAGFIYGFQELTDNKRDLGAGDVARGVVPILAASVALPMGYRALARHVGRAGKGVVSTISGAAEIGLQGAEGAIAEEVPSALWHGMPAVDLLQPEIDTFARAARVSPTRQKVIDEALPIVREGIEFKREKANEILEQAIGSRTDEGRAAIHETWRQEMGSEVPPEASFRIDRTRKWISEMEAADPTSLNPRLTQNEWDYFQKKRTRVLEDVAKEPWRIEPEEYQRAVLNHQNELYIVNKKYDAVLESTAKRFGLSPEEIGRANALPSADVISAQIAKKQSGRAPTEAEFYQEVWSRLGGGRGSQTSPQLFTYGMKRMELAANLAKFSEDTGKARSFLVRAARQMGELREPADAAISAAPPPMAAGSSSRALGDLSTLSETEFAERLAERGVFVHPVDDIVVADAKRHVDPGEAGLPPNVVGVVADPRSKKLVAVSNTHLLAATNPQAIPGPSGGKGVIVRRLDKVPGNAISEEVKRLREGPGIYVAADHPISSDILRLAKGRKVAPHELPGGELYHVTTAGDAFDFSGNQILRAARQPGSDLPVISFFKSVDDAANAQRALRATVSLAKLGGGKPKDLVRAYRSFVRREARDGFLGPIEPDDFVAQVFEQTPDPSNVVDLMKRHFRLREVLGGAQNPGVIIDQATLGTIDPKNVRMLVAAADDIPPAALVMDNMARSPYANEVLTFADAKAGFRPPAASESLYPAVQVGVPVSDNGTLMHPGADAWDPARYSEMNKIGLTPELPPRTAQDATYWTRRGHLFLPDGASVPSPASTSGPLPKSAASQARGAAASATAPESGMSYSKILAQPGSPEAKRYVRDLEALVPKPLKAQRYEVSEDFEYMMRGIVAAGALLKNSTWSTLSAGWADNAAIEMAKIRRGSMGRYYQRSEAARREMVRGLLGVASRRLGFFRNAIDDVTKRFDKIVADDPEKVINGFYGRIEQGLPFEDIPGHMTAGELGLVHETMETLLQRSREEIESLNPETKKLWMDNYAPRIWDLPLSQETFRRLYQTGDLQRNIDRMGLGGVKLEGLGLAEYLIKDGMTEEQFYSAVSAFSGNKIPGMRGSGTKAFLGARRRSRGEGAAPDFMSEMTSLGFVPVTYNPIQQTLFKIDQMERFAANARTFQGMIDNGMTVALTDKQYKNILGTTYLRGGDSPPLVDVSDAIRDFYHERIPGYAVEAGPGKKYYSTPSVALLLRRITSKGVMERAGPLGQKVFSHWLNSNNTLNAFQLGISAFHLGVMATENLANELTLAGSKFWTATAPTPKAAAKRAALQRLPEVIPGAEKMGRFELLGESAGHAIKSMTGTSLALGRGMNTSARMNRAWHSLDRQVAGLIRHITAGKFDKDHFLQSKIFDDVSEMPAKSMGEVWDDAWLGMTPSHQYDPVTKMVLESVPLAGARFRFTEHEWRSKLATSFAGVRADMKRDQMAGVLRSGMHYGGKHISAIVGDAAEISSQYIFNTVVPNTKAAAYMEKMRWEIMKAGGDLSPDQLQRIAMKTQDNIDDRFGMVVYDNLFWNRAVKDIAHTLFRAPGWNWGTLAVMGGAAYDTGKFVTQAARIGADRFKWGKYKGQYLNGGKSIEKMSFPEVTDRMAYMIALFTTVPMMGALYQVGMTGQWPELDWSANTVEEWRDNYYKLVFPWNGLTNRDGTKDRSNEPSYMKDILTWMSIASFQESPAEVISHKLSPMVGGMYEFASGEDHWRNMTYDPEAPWYVQLGQRAGAAAKHAVVPFSLQSVAERSASLGDQKQTGIDFPSFRIPGTEMDVSTRALLEASIGWVPASQRFEQSRSMQYMKALQRQYRPAGPKIPQAQARSEALYELEQGLVSGNQQKVHDFAEKQAGLGITTADIGRVTKRAAALQQGMYAVQQFQSTPFQVPAEMNSALEQMNPDEFVQFFQDPNVLDRTLLRLLERNTTPDEQEYWARKVQTTIADKIEQTKDWMIQKQRREEIYGGSN